MKMPNTPSAPSVSVMMTVKNGARFIEAALESVYAQSVLPAEIVVVDDGSTDETPEILRRYAGRTPEVRVLAPGGVGRSAALNLAWRSARSELIANLDADDIFLPGKLEAQLAEFARNPELDLLATASRYIDAEPESAGTPDVADLAASPPAPPHPALPGEQPLCDLARLLPRYNPVNHSSVMMRRSLLEALDGYNTARRRQLDYDLWIRAAAAGAVQRIIDLPYTGKRIHSAQSFEVRDHLRYVLSSLQLQLGAIRALHADSNPSAVARRARLYLLAFVRVAYRLLPLSLRRRLASAKEQALRR